MIIVLEQTAALFLFGFIGWLLCRAGVIRASQTGLLSALEVYVFLPGLSIRTFSMYFTPTYLRENGSAVLAALVLLTVLILLSRPLSLLFSKETGLRDVYRYSLIIPNFGYVGYALAQSMFGDVGLLRFMVFCLPFSCFAQSEGYRMLTGGKASLRSLFSPTVIGLLIGCLLGLTGFTPPTFLLSSLEMASRCVAPVSLLLTGMVLSEFPLRDLLRDRKAYWISLLRLAVLPALGGLLAKRFCTPETARSVILFLMMPCGMNTIVFPRMVDRDCKPGASMALVSNLMAIAAIPLMAAWML